MSAIRVCVSKSREQFTGGSAFLRSVTCIDRFIVGLTVILRVMDIKTLDWRINSCERLNHMSRGSKSSRVSSSCAGMTLIEVLVAVGLMSMLTVGLLTSLQIGATSWSTTNDVLVLDRRVANANMLLRSLVASIVPINTRTLPGSEIPSYEISFFQGESHSMRFVSSHSISFGSRGKLQLTELQVDPHQGTLRLLLNQFDYQGPHMLSQLVMGRVPVEGVPGGRLVFRPIMPLSTTLIAIDQLVSCTFSYLSRRQPNNEPPTWARIWNERDTLPAAVRIELKPLTEPDYQSRALPISVTTPIFAQHVKELSELEIYILRKAGRLP
jgi:hypothetical protein